MPDQSDGDVDYDIDDDDVDHVLEKRRMLEVYDKGSKCYDLASEYPSDEEGLEEPGLDELDMDGDECRWVSCLLHVELDDGSFVP